MWDRRSRVAPERGDLPGPGSSGGPAHLGRSLGLHGELSGDEDLTIDGRVEGKVTLRGHELVIGRHGRLRASLEAKRVIIHGHVEGDVSAAEMVEIRAGGRLEGDIVAPRLGIADGARFRGKVDMERRRPAAGDSGPAPSRRSAAG